MQSGIVFLPDGRAEARNDIPEDVILDGWDEWSAEQKQAYSDFVGTFPTIADGNNWHVQLRYVEMRLAGESHNMAEMLATRTFPGVKTDAVFNEGKFSSDSGIHGAEQTWLRARAEAAGVSTNGKWYCRGLASFPGDPTAWVGDRGDVLRIAREKNMTVHGYVECKGHETDPGDDLTIASDIIDDEVSDIMESHPFADREAVREEVYRLRTGAVDPNPLVVQDTPDELPV